MYRLPCVRPRVGRASSLLAAPVLLTALLVGGCGGSTNSPRLTVVPGSAEVLPGSRQTFTALTNNGTSDGYDFTVTHTAGAGSAGVMDGPTYLAPDDSIGAGFQDTITVTSRRNGSLTQKIVVSVPLRVTVTPNASDVSVNRSVRLGATVAGDKQNRVTWVAAARRQWRRYLPGRPLYRARIRDRWRP